MPLRYIVVNLLNLFVAAVETILGLRFVLKLFGANETASFVSWVYEMSSVLLDPFRGIFPVKMFENQYVFEFTTLFAMLIYALLGVLVLAVINAVTAPVVAATVAKKRRTR